MTGAISLKICFDNEFGDKQGLDKLRLAQTDNSVGSEINLLEENVNL